MGDVEDARKLTEILVELAPWCFYRKDPRAIQFGFGLSLGTIEGIHVGAYLDFPDNSVCLLKPHTGFEEQLGKLFMENGLERINFLRAQGFLLHFKRRFHQEWEAIVRQLRDE